MPRLKGWQPGFEITWQARGGRAKVAANPAYPKGTHFDLSNGSGKTCLITLPYPAPAVGNWIVHCNACILRMTITAAGRTDDPRTVKVRCREVERDPDAVLH